MKNLTSFRIGLFAIAFEWSIFFISLIFSHTFGFSTLACAVYWTVWTIFYLKKIK